VRRIFLSLPIDQAVVLFVITHPDGCLAEARCTKPGCSWVLLINRPMSPKDELAEAEKQSVKDHEATHRE
jgi:hypothetical protein